MNSRRRNVTHQRDHSYSQERQSATAVRRSRQTVHSNPTPEQHAALTKWALGGLLSQAEYAQAAQHPYICQSSREMFEALAGDDDDWKKHDHEDHFAAADYYDEIARGQ